MHFFAAEVKKDGYEWTVKCSGIWDLIGFLSFEIGIWSLGSGFEICIRAMGFGI